MAPSWQTPAAKRPVSPMSELRWNPVLGEWLVTATHRQERTFLPPEDYCPLCPTRPGGFPTEIPAPSYDIVTFENRFPAFQTPAPTPAVVGTELYPVRPAVGKAEVVCYTPEHHGTLASQPLDRVHHLVRVWRHRYEHLGALPEIAYVFIFENKGTVIGVTLEHPHGQIYAYPFIPTIPARELANGAAHQARTGRCLLCDVVAAEHDDGRRIVAESSAFVAAVPFYARWPYEVHIWSRRHLGALSDFTPQEDRELAAMLLRIARGYDHLPGFEPPFPYMMALHQRPSDGAPHQAAHFHVEFYPPFRRPDRLKYLATAEAGGGNFLNDTLPEEKAAELRAAVAGVGELA